MLQVACVGKDMSASLHCVCVTFLFPHESDHQRKKMFTQGQVNICGFFLCVINAPTNNILRKWCGSHTSQSWNVILRVLCFRTLDRSSPVFAPEIIFCLVTLKTFDLITDLRHLFLQTNQRSYTGHDVASWWFRILNRFNKCLYCHLLFIFSALQCLDI